jgi:hypothetical protein
MNPLTHAEAILAGLRLRHPEYVYPGYASSPMDDMDTVVLPRELIVACDSRTGVPQEIDTAPLAAPEAGSARTAHAFALPQRRRAAS